MAVPSSSCSALLILSQCCCWDFSPLVFLFPLPLSGTCSLDGVPGILRTYARMCNYLGRILLFKCLQICAPCLRERAIILFTRSSLIVTTNCAPGARGQSGLVDSVPRAQIRMTPIVRSCTLLLRRLFAARHCRCRRRPCFAWHCRRLAVIDLRHYSEFMYLVATLRKRWRGGLWSRVQ